jgi:phage gp29-like protein
MADEEKKEAGKPITDEIATTRKDIDIFTGWLNRLENPDPTLRTEAGGKGLKLYDEVDRDPHAGSVLQTRYLSVAGKEWEILPGDDSENAKKIADFVTTALTGMNFTQAFQELLQGILYGFFVAEIIWGVRKGQWVPVRLIGKHPRRFSFTMYRELRLLTPQNIIEGEPVPDRKFIVFSWGSTDNPYGKGLGQKLWWPVWFKKNGIKFWMVFLDKFGMPTGIGKYPPGTSKEQQQALLDAIDAIQNETGVKIPDTMSIDLLEAARTGKVTYETLCEYMDKQVSKAVLGQTASTEGTPGKLGNEEIQEEVRQDILKADADLLCECLNNTLIKWLVDYNFPNVSEYPELWIRTKEEGDLRPLAERDKIIAGDLRVPVGVKYFYDTYGIPAPEKGEEIIQVQPKQAAPAIRTGGQFSDTGHDLSPTAALEALGEKTLNAANLDGLVQPIEDLLAGASSLEEFRDRLLDAYGDMPAADLGNLMQRAFTLADLSGRFDAQER